VLHLLEDVGVEVGLEIEEAAAELEAWIGPARVSASFPTLLDSGPRAQ